MAAVDELAPAATGDEPAGLLAAMGWLAYRFRWFVIAIWLGAIALAALPAAGVADVLKSGGFVISGIESQRAYDRLKRDLKLQGQALGVVAQSTQSVITDPTFATQLDRWQAALHAQAPQATVKVGPVSSDRHTAMIGVYGVDDYESQKRLAAAAGTFSIAGPARTYLIGAGPFFQTLEAQSQKDVVAAEQRSLPAALVFLLLIFGGLIAAGVPLAVGLASVTLSLALLALLGRLTDISIFAQSVTTMLGLGIGIDYSLIMVNRFREERRTRPLSEAIAMTASAAGRTVLLSGLTVVIGFSALATSGIVPLRSMGIGGMIVVILSLLTALTLLPAILGVVGNHVDRWGFAWARPRAGGFWHRLAVMIMRRPVRVIVAVTLLALLLASPVRTLNVNLTGDEVLPADSPLRVGTAIAQQSLNQPRTQPLMIALISDDLMSDPGVIRSVRVFEDQVKKDPEVSSVMSYADGISPGGQSPMAVYGVAPGALAVSQHTGLLVAQLRDQPNAVAAEEAVKRVRSVALPANLRTLVGGEPAFDLDWTNAIYGPFPWIIAAVLAITYLLLLVGFRSVVLPLKAILMNLLSLAVAYGMVTFIFQWGHLRGLLGFSPQLSIESTVPIVMFAGLFGLSMDYEVFLLSRVAEEYRRSGDNRQAVALGMKHTGRIITSAAMVMVIVFGFFALSTLVATKEVGLGFAIAIAVDASIIRLLLVPAWMRVLGRWNWWLPKPAATRARG